MTHNKFALKYPEVVKQVQNVVFPCVIEGIRIKNARDMVHYIIESGDVPVVDLHAVADALRIYEVDPDLFEDYKDIIKDMNLVLGNKSKYKLDRDTQ